MLLLLILCLPGFGAAKSLSGSRLSPSQSQLSDSKAAWYLRRYGYMDSPLVNSLESALQSFQAQNRLPVTGKMDTATRAAMSGLRCGVRDVRTSGAARSLLRRRAKRFALEGDRLPGPVVTWRIAKYSTSHLPDVTREWQENTFARAFALWEAVIPIRFRRISSGKADIEISFEKGYHGDDQYFDGNGGTLAHAFFPNEGPQGGNVHFDDEEPWRPGGRNLLWVAAHELGHSLGLRHSGAPEALMSSHYGGYEKGDNVRLSQDDIDGIQALYGKPTQQLPRKPSARNAWSWRYTTTTTAAPPTTTRRPSRRRPYSLLSRTWASDYTRPSKKSKKTWMDSYKRSLLRSSSIRRRSWGRWTTARPSRPSFSSRSSSSSRRDAPKAADPICRDASVDAAFALKNGTLVVIKERQFWLIDLAAKRAISSGDVSDWGLRLGYRQRVRAALPARRGYITLFVGSTAWELRESDLRRGRASAKGPLPLRKLRSYSKAPAGLDASLQMRRSVYFFQRSSYYSDSNSDGARDAHGHPIREISPRLWSIDAAVSTGEEGLLFAGQRYWRVRESQGRLMSEGQSGKISEDLFGCPSSEHSSLRRY